MRAGKDAVDDGDGDDAVVDVDECLLRGDRFG